MAYEIYFSNKSGAVVTLPVNPSEFTIPREGGSETSEVVGIGEVNIIKDPKLIKIDIESFFPPSSDVEGLTRFFNEAVTKKETLRIIFKEMNLNMLVSVTNFNVSKVAGREKSNLYNLSLLEWREYKPITVDIPQPPAQETPQPQEQPQAPQQEVVTETKTIDVGSKVKFLGGHHYYTSLAPSPTGKPLPPTMVEITLKAEGNPHPFHAIGGRVYGWVNREDLEA